MVGLFNWLWTAFLDACGIAREVTVDYGLVSDPELVGSVDHSNEDINWRGAPVYQATGSPGDINPQNCEGCFVRRRRPYIADGNYCFRQMITASDQQH
ncbi:uncharacterized protein N7473_012968 [Penicillium subrubescens]|uniref:Uncharacterized protein n=1 Tax=Penicillium subrubescens TaxID=1316194 RepID=A0A1Q5T6P6_9EURO|nr:uncharacterized protein N7473_012968 [Penicillium subrubescens]KAJ5875621.1 hypothetical protein N7473_012968 [Penicillium subrubescens]OKO95927.1 hypothetical protein PENSUB_10948 [Penicillium subrubescens]